MAGARFVLNSRYFHVAKPGEVISNYALSAEHISELVRYVGTRESVVFNISDETKALPATERQIEKIKEFTELLEKNGNCDYKEFLEYDDYLQAPTRQNASELISRLSEMLMFGDYLYDIKGAANLVEYAAKRPGAVKFGKHGLFSSYDNVNLQQAMDEISSHKGNIWTHILSLRREDADRLGYDTQAPWRNLIMAHIDDIAKEHQISVENLRWYAAMHNTGHHPHIHLFVYSSDPNEGFFSEKVNNSVSKLKSKFATDIFRDDLKHTYIQKQTYREELKTQAAQTLNKLLNSKNAGFEQDKINNITDKMLMLSDKLPDKGRILYGYSNKGIKGLVDEIQKSLITDNTYLTSLYQNWCEQKYSIERLYVNDPEPRSIENEKEFIPIKNEILQQAYNLKNGITHNLDIGTDNINYVDNIETENIYVSANDPIDFEISDNSEKAVIINFENPTKWTDITFLDDKTNNTNLQKNKNSNNDPIKYYLKNYPDQIFYSQEPQHLEVLNNSNLIFISDKNDVKKFKALSILANNFETRSAEICQKLADCYNYGRGTEKDEAKAQMWYGIAVDEFNDSMSAYHLAELYYYGTNDIEIDTDLANHYFKTAYIQFRDEIKNAQYFYELESNSDNLNYYTKVGRDDVCKEYLIGRMYMNGQGIEQNYDKANKVFQLAAENGYYKFMGDQNYFEQNLETALSYYLKAEDYNKNAMVEYRIGLIYYDRRDIDNTVIWLNKATHNGNSSAALKLAKIYGEGVKVPKNNEKSMLYYNISAELGNPYASYYLGNINLKQEKILEAVKDFKKAAEKNISHAWYKLGQIYSSEVYGLLDENQAHVCYANALKQYITDYDKTPDDFTSYRIGQMYLSAQGTEKNIAEAVSWFIKSYEQGNNDIAHQLGNIYKSDKYGLKNDLLSAKYYRSALSFYEAEFNKSPNGDLAMKIGSFYHYGLGIERNIEKSIEWYKKAVMLGNLKAQQKIEESNNDRQIAMVSIATTACHFGRMINTETMAASKNRIVADSKLLRKEKIKKIYSGQAINDNKQSYDY